MKVGIAIVKSVASWICYPEWKVRCTVEYGEVSGYGKKDKFCVDVVYNGRFLKRYSQIQHRGG